MDQTTPAPADDEQPAEQQAPYTQPYTQQYAPTASRPTNALAIISLVASLTGLTILPFVGSVAGVITGHLAKRQIAETQEEGSGLALAGLIMGYVGIGLGVLAVLAAILFFGLFVTTLGVVGTTSGY